MSADGTIKIDTKLDSSTFKSGLKQMEDIASKANDGMKTLTNTVTAGFTAAAGAVSAAGTAVVKFGSEFESSLAKASTLFGDVQVDTDVLTEKILSLSNSTGVAASAIGESLYNALSAGIPATEDMGDAMAYMESCAKIAKAGFTDVDTAVTATAKILNAYKMDVSNVDKVHKILMQTQNNGITTVGELGASLAQVTPTAAAMGVTFDQVGAALATMTAAGTPTAQATTQLNSLFAELGKSGTVASENLRTMSLCSNFAHMGFDKIVESGIPAEKLIEVFGEQIKEFNGEIQSVEDIDKFVEGLNQLEKEGYISAQSFQEMMDSGKDLNYVLNLMVGYAEASDKSMLDMFSSVEAGKAALAMSGQNAEAFTNNLAAMSTEADVVGVAYEKVSNTFEVNSQKIGNSLKNLGIAMYQDVDTPLADITATAADMVQQLTDAYSEGGFDGLLESVGDVLSKVVTKVAEAAPKIVELGVGLISSLVDGLSKNSGSIIKAAQSAMSSFFGGIRSVMGQIGPLAGEIVSLILEGFIGYYELVWTAGVELVTQLITGIAKKAPDLIKSAQSAITNIVNGLKKNLPAILKAGIEIITQLIKGISQMLPNLFKTVVKIILNLAETILDNLDAIIDAVMDCIVAIADALLEALPILLEKLPTIIENLINGLVSGLLGNLDKVIEAGIKMIIALGEALCNPMELLKIAGSIISGLFAGLVNGLAGLVSGIFSAFNAEIEANADLSKAQAILEQEKAYNDELREAIKVREDLHKKAEEKVQDALTEEAMCQRLVAELEKVVDANGKVKEGYEGRVDFILNELNSALGTEYKRTGDVIDQYGNLTDSIEKVIKKKKAQILLEAYEEEYKNALKTQNDLLAQQVENEISLSEKQAEVSKLRAELADLEKQQKQALMAEDDKMIAKLYDEINAKEAVLKTTEETLLQVMDRHSAAEIAITQNYETIDKYESASAALLSDNAEKAAKILQGKSEAQEAYAGSVEQSVVRNKEALREEMDQAEVAYKQMKDRLDRHIAGVTQDMVDEYEQRYKDAKKAYRSLGEISIDELNTAIESKNPFLQKQLKQLGVLSRSNIKKELDSTSIGVNFVDGIASGIENRKSSLFSRVTDFMNGIFSVARKVQDSHSPSRRAKKEIGEMWGAGVEEGVEASTQDTAEAASRQVNAMFEAATFDADRYAARLRNSVAFDTAHTAACVSNTVNYYNTSSVNESNTQSTGALVNIERVEINNDTDAEALGNELGFIISREDAFK